MDRRRFLQTAAATTLVASMQSRMAHAEAGTVPTRKLGRTGEKVSIVGLGGYHIGKQADEQESIRIIRTALDSGINFLDNCWDYNGGLSEVRMGKALRDGYRDQVFLMTKFDGRTKKSTARQIDESLQRLQTDHVDLIQFHENIRMEDPDRFFASDGPLEALLEAKKAGKIRFIGFTGHKDPVVHLRMLEVAAEHKFRFETCQMPLNVMDAHFRSFGRQVLPKLVEQGMGVLGMKPLGEKENRSSGPVFIEPYLSANEVIRSSANRIKPASAKSGDSPR